jgi:hypothetical protein
MNRHSRSRGRTEYTAVIRVKCDGSYALVLNSLYIQQRERRISSNQHNTQHTYNTHNMRSLSVYIVLFDITASLLYHSKGCFCIRFHSNSKQCSTANRSYTSSESSCCTLHCMLHRCFCCCIVALLCIRLYYCLVYNST